MELALSIISLVIGLVSIGLAVFSMISTKKMQNRIVNVCKDTRKLIDGKDDLS